MDSTNEINNLMHALKIATEKVQTLQKEIADQTTAGADDVAILEPLRQQLEAARKDASTTQSSLFDEWSKMQVPVNTITVQDNRKTEGTSSHSHSKLIPEDDFQETPITARGTHIREYKNGEDFTTWCSRFKRYLRSNRLRRKDAHDLLLSLVDDRTLEKLEPVAEKLSPEEQRDPELFIPLFEEAIYPKTDVRALRQELTGSDMRQGNNEDVESFASRVRNFGKRAYGSATERHEPCLNAFLHGLKDRSLYQEVVKDSRAQDDFELAAKLAASLDKLQRSTNHRHNEQYDVLRLERSTPGNRDRNTYDDRNNNSSADSQQESNDNRSYRRQNNDHGRHNYEQNNYRRNSNGNSRGRTYNTNATRPNNRRENRTCFLCHKRGHVVANCFQNPLNLNRAGNSQGTGPNQ